MRPGPTVANVGNMPATYSQSLSQPRPNIVVGRMAAPSNANIDAPGCRLCSEAHVALFSISDEMNKMSDFSQIRFVNILTATEVSTYLWAIESNFLLSSDHHY